MLLTRAQMRLPAERTTLGPAYAVTNWMHATLAGSHELVHTYRTVCDRIVVEELLQAPVLHTDRHTKYDTH